MRSAHFLAALTFLALGSALRAEVDLAKIDRTIAKEPAYKTKPKYGLLVFGPEAKSRVWLVLDGDVLYADKNGIGDLTEKGERIEQGPTHDQTIGFSVGEPSLPDDSFPKNSSGLAIYRDAKQGATDALRFSITINQNTWLGVLPKLADQPQDAPILHFNFDGPLTFVCLDPPIFVPGKTTNLVIHIGTPGLGEKVSVWRSHASSIVGGQVGLRAEIEYPSKVPGGKPVFATQILPLED
jgi:hypothetical protein